ncbi:hypothetical protein EO244_10275 [Ancylomarina salipaludis]|uniref:DUF4468 domain-containing protein n=1 Tax=Ancylomarina salipaludis TaxID=2501299 RepID=A0A4Q1JKR9_9BACT|nr:hypothetical protein [Ancylomarina salipaludis]RXQ93953.1 hypothetical protein EO244_10275 [Ancylomarina salipaludis]
MRVFMIIPILILAQLSIVAQNKNTIKTNLDANGELQIELQLDQQEFQFDQYQNWIKSVDHFVSGEVVQVSSEKFIYKGKTLIYLSEKPSTFQTELLFTLNITQNQRGTKLVLNDIHYKSLPEYGKQGTPAIQTDCSDWFAKKKLYKKSGKMRTLNQNLMNNSSQFAEKLILSCLD